MVIGPVIFAWLTCFWAQRGICNYRRRHLGRGPGAWEAKARWSCLDLSDISKGQYNDVTVGFSWYWSDRTRIMFDWIHPLTSSQAVYGATESDILAMRFDFNW